MNSIESHLEEVVTDDLAYGICLESHVMLFKMSITSNKPRDVGNNKSPGCNLSKSSLCLVLVPDTL